VCELVGDELFAVLLADDLMVCEVPCLAQMVEAYEDAGGNLDATIEVPRTHTQRYGVLDVVKDDGRLVRASGVVEKPEPAAAASTLTIIGRYIIQSEVFDHLARTEPGSGGEIQLTDALAKLIEDGQTFHGLRFEGKRFDCGDKLGFLEATVALDLEHPDLGPGLRRILASYLRDRSPRCRIASTRRSCASTISAASSPRPCRPPTHERSGGLLR
jgi:UTP--glucose-1-phosphate uridylyltransferase